MISRHVTHRSRPRRASAALAIVAALAALSVAACSPDSTQSPPSGLSTSTVTSPTASASAAADALHPFTPGSRRVPAGFREVLCPVQSGAGIARTVRLVVPVRTQSMNLDGHGCGFGWGMVGGVSVGLADQSLATYKKKELDPYEDVGGDDEITDLGAITATTGFGTGDHRAESLRYRVYDDGLPFWQEVIQDDGIRVGLSVPPKRRRELRQLAIVARSVAVVRGYRALCPGWGSAARHTVSFVPPTVASSVEREADLCRIYFDGSPTTLQSALLDPDPAPLRQLVRQLVRQVRKDPEATRVRLQRGETRLAGEPADRLTWVVVRKKPKEYEPAGTWRIVVLQSASARVQWGQTPRWWRAHRAVFDRFAASIRSAR